MGIEFNADEIFEIAQQIERNGARFYRAASKRASSDRTRKLLAGLADWEDQHERTFAGLRAEFSGAEWAEPGYDPYGEAASYLRAFADGHVFNVKADPAEMLTGEESMEEILQTAIGLEKDSIVFYLGIEQMVPQRLGKDRIGKIVREEMGHVTMLSDELAGLEA